MTVSYGTQSLMHIRDRLRTVLLLRKTSQFCGLCASSPRQQLRSVRTAGKPRLDLDAAPTELELLLGQQGNSDAHRVEARTKIGHDETLDINKESVLPRIRRYRKRDRQHASGNDLVETAPLARSRCPTVDEPIYRGTQNQRSYVFRGVRNNMVHISYKYRRFLKVQDLEEDLSEKGKSVENEGQTLEETEELFQNWLGLLNPLPPSAFPRRPVVKQDGNPAIRAQERDNRTVRPAFALDTTPAPPENNKSPSIAISAQEFGQGAIKRASRDHKLNTASDLPSRRPLGMPTWLSASNNHIIRHGGSTIPYRSHAARLHTGKASRSPSVSGSSLHTGSDITPQIPSVQEVGIREHLRLWQEWQNEGPTRPPLSPQPGFSKPNLKENAESELGEDVLSVTSDSLDPALSRDWGVVCGPDKDQDGEVDTHNFLKPGDVIGFRTKAEPLLAIFIRNFEYQSQFYSIQGKWFHMGSQFVSFRINDVFSQQDIDPIVQYLPDKEIDTKELEKLQSMKVNVPQGIGAPLLERLQALSNASAEVYREHAETLDRAHSLVAHERDFTEMTLPDIAMVVLQKRNVSELTDAMLWAVDKALTRNPNFRKNRSFYHRGYPLWRINPAVMMQGHEQVRIWVREYLEGIIAQATSLDGASSVFEHDKDSRSSNPIPTFLRKARRLVKSSRTHRSVTAHAGLGPMDAGAMASKPPQRADFRTKSLVAFDKLETELIMYLKSWCVTWDITSAGGTWSLSPALLRATGLYEGHALDERTGYLFLQELGVLAPWENRFAYSGDVLPAVHKDSKIEKPAAVGAPFTPLNQRLEDSLEHLRRDWGNLPVYCIDDASAQEIDDGISLERPSGEDALIWVHIHVANPSAFLKPNDAVGRYAAQLLETIYLPDKSYPLLHPTLSQARFSLAENRPVLTFSAKLTHDGEIVETDITPGWIRNVKRITPTRLSRELGLDENTSERPSQLLQVGQPKSFTPAEAAEDHLLSPSEAADLRTLQQLGVARRLKRTSGESATRSFHGTVPEPQVFVERGGISRMFNAHLGRQFIGDPSISWEASEVDMTGELRRENSQVAVADIMILAGEIAGRWCGERNIPAVYRGTIRDPAPNMSPEAYKTNVIDHAMQSKGYIPIMLYRSYNRLLGQSTYRSSPFPHAILGTQSYMKATSPLRRYQDMLAHWQIQAALLNEARHGKRSLVGRNSNSSDGSVTTDDDAYLPFSRADLDALVPSLELRERAITDMSKKSSVHWIMQLLHRAFYFKEADLPPVFDLLVHRETEALAPRGNAIAYTKQLSGIDADLLENEVSKKAGGIRVGDWWQARIEGVDTYGARLRMVPVRLTERDAFGLE
ncbi:MAG: hypothetical protein LQ341_005666 [Variospora aurantia]|nr:MAG: hypothetical protein LQ341_005666 [Variospora aurantia]